MRILKKLFVILFICLLLPKASYASVGDGRIIDSIRFIYEKSAVYDVHCRAGYITALNLSPNEEVMYVGAGDTARWILDAARSSNNGKAFFQLLIKPLRDNINTNLIINTTKRSYQINLIATTGTYNTYIEWVYADEQNISDKLNTVYGSSNNITANNPSNSLESLNNKITLSNNPPKLNMDYKINGDKVNWKPLKVFDDGQKTFILMPASITVTEAPVLYMKRGRDLSMVNYRLKSPYYIIDRLVQELEMRCGKEKVKILNTKKLKDLNSEEVDL